MADLSDEEKRQLKNCFEVIKQYQEKQKMNPKRTKFGEKQILENKSSEKKNNDDSRAISRMLSGVKHLTPEDRRRGTKMLDDLEHDRGHSRGRGR